MAEPMTEIVEVVAQMERLRKTVLCPPELVSQVRALIHQHSPVAGLYDVQPSAFTDGHIYIVDASAAKWAGDGQL